MAANWRTVDENDLAATISQSEIDAFRRDGATDGSDAVARLLDSTVSYVRSFCTMNGRVKMGPDGTIPAGLVVPAMDYASAKVLKRIDVPLNEDRRAALKRAEELFEKISQGAITPESYAADGQLDDDARPASAPAFAPATPERLLD